MSSVMPCGGDAFAAFNELLTDAAFRRCRYCAHAAHEAWCGCGRTDDEGKCLGPEGYEFARAAGIELQGMEGMA